VSAAKRTRRPPESATVGSLLAGASRRLARARLTYGHGTDNPHDEAACLVLHALRLPAAPLNGAALQRRVSAADARHALELIAARIERRVPAAYLTHEAWLADLRFYVDERVIVPRSFIAELLRQRLEPWLLEPDHVRRALDLCTGSGCLAVILAKMFPHTRVDAVDLSATALAVARRNLARFRLGRRVTLIESDMFSALHGKRYDLIISNPPYVTTSVMRKLPPEYRREPALALAGGDDGFAVVDIILREAALHLAVNGLLVVEIGHHRRRLEASYPRLPFVWPETSGGDDCVFVLTRADLVAPGALQRRPAPRPARPETAASRRR
jgi:ribosomal protein L3 glutamine methyltransferase